MNCFKNDFVCTDPDTGQYGRQIEKGKSIYEFYTERSNDRAVIDLSNYASTTIESIVNSYGYTVQGAQGYENIRETQIDNWEFLTAECIYETEFESNANI